MVCGFASGHVNMKREGIVVAQRLRTATDLMTSRQGLPGMEDTSEAGVRTHRSPSHERRLALLGVRMTPELMVEVKVEAARKGMSVADLFEAIWTDYVSKRDP